MLEKLILTKMYHGFHKKYLAVFNTDNKKIWFLSTKSTY